MFKDNKKLVDETVFIKEALKNNLSLQEFLLLLFFDNSFDLVFDMKVIAKTINMSEDEVKRLEYEARQKAIRDYNSYMHSAERKGRNEGIKLGKEELLKQQVKKKLAKGKSLEAIADECEEETSVIRTIINEIGEAE